MLGNLGDIVDLRDAGERLQEAADIKCAPADAIKDGICMVDVGLHGFVDGTAEANKGVGELKSKRGIELATDEERGLM